MVGIRAPAGPSGRADSQDRMDHPQHAMRGVKNLLPAMSFFNTLLAVDADVNHVTVLDDVVTAFLA